MGAPASRGQSLREAIGFAFGVLGFRGGQALAADRMLRGLAWQSMARRNPRRQAPALPVAFVRALEEYGIDSDPDRLAVVAGTLLFCCYARLRFGDLVRSTEEPQLDVEGSEGFVELNILVHKTAGPVPNRRLPAVAHARGVASTIWAGSWLEARAACGVVSCKETGFLPMLADDGTWMGRRMSTSEASEFLKYFLRKLCAMPAAEANRYGASSL